METGQFRRNTRQRQVILNELRGITSHPTAADLYQMVRQHLPKISLGTVYRNLGVLVEEGRLIEVIAEDGARHYDADTGPHAHVVCSRCGRIADLLLPRAIAKQLVIVAQEQTGFSVGENMHLTGICVECGNTVQHVH